jgi:hypothetical protein
MGFRRSEAETAFVVVRDFSPLIRRLLEERVCLLGVTLIWRNGGW